MHALIALHNGSAPPARLLAAADRPELVIATDGAARKFSPESPPDIICGDLDSISAEEAARRFPRAEIVALPDQNSSDLDKALLLARERGARRITLCCTRGGRIDHELTALSTVLRHHTQLEIVIAEQTSLTRLLSPTAIGGETLEFTATADDIISIIPLTDHAVVSANGVQWPLDRRELSAGAGGVSNRARGETIKITVHRGVAAVCHLW